MRRQGHPVFVVQLTVESIGITKLSTWHARDRSDGWVFDQCM